jgi:hypothetical protein
MKEFLRQGIKISTGLMLIYFQNNRNIQILLISISSLIIQSFTFGIGLFLSILFSNLEQFNKEITIFCIFFLTIGDSVSNLVGNSLGKIEQFKIFIFKRNGKSFVGSMISFTFLYIFSFFYLFFNSNFENGFLLFFISISISIFGSFLEILSPMDDNIFIPVMSGIFIQFIFNLFQINFTNPTFNSYLNKSCSSS